MHITNNICINLQCCIRCMVPCTQGRQGSTGGPSTPAREVPDDLGQLAADRLLQLYAAKQPSLVAVVQASLASMGFR